MKRALFSLTTGIIICLHCSGQTTFYKGYCVPGGEQLTAGYSTLSVKETVDGGYILGGAKGVGIESSLVFFVKTNASGDTLWSKLSNHTFFSYDEYSFMETADGGYIITGGVYASWPTAYIHLIKTNDSGDSLWTRSFTFLDTLSWPMYYYGGAGYSVQQSNDGGYIVLGTLSPSGPVLPDPRNYLIKTDMGGDVQWVKRYGNDYGNSLRQTSDGGFIIGGTAVGIGAGSYDFYLLKTDSSGNFIWAKTYGGASEEKTNAVTPTLDGGYLVCGYTKSFGAGGEDVYVIKVNANGNLEWSKTYGGPGNDRGISIELTNDGGFIISGFFIDTIANNKYAYLIKTDSQGDTLWTKVYGESSVQIAGSAKQTQDGGYIIAGSQYIDSTYNSCPLLIKTDVDGNSGCNYYNTNTIVGSPTTTVNSYTVQASDATGILTLQEYMSISNTNLADTTFCQFVGLGDELTGTTEILTYPNPNTGEFVLSMELSKPQWLKLKVMNIMGQVIYEEKTNRAFGKYDKVIDLSDHAKGIYTLQLTSGEGTVTRKIILQ